MIKALQWRRHGNSEVAPRLVKSDLPWMMKTIALSVTSPSTSFRCDNNKTVPMGTGLGHSGVTFENLLAL